MTHLPKSKAMRDAVTRVDRDKARVDFIKRYSDLYGMYTETEVVYTDERVRGPVGVAHRRGQRERFPFDAGVRGLEVLPAGRALPGGDPVAPRAVAEATARSRP